MQMTGWMSYLKIGAVGRNGGRDSGGRDRIFDSESVCVHRGARSESEAPEPWTVREMPKALQGKRIYTFRAVTICSP